MVTMIPKTRLVKGKSKLWDFVFPQKVLNRKTTLGGLGEKAVTIKLDSSKAYPHLDIKAFLMWADYDKWTDEEKELVNVLLKELDSSSS